MFDALQPAPPDAILGLNEAFAKDPRAGKINLSVGVYCDANGTTPVLESVKQAERRLIEDERTKSYLGMAGIPQFAELTRQLVLGPQHAVVQQQRAATLQTPGGTGALRVAADFIKRQLPSARVWCSRPTWANHPGIFAAAGLPVESYAYLDASNRALDFDAMLGDLQKIPAGDVVVLHACCHNPSGVDLTIEQWQEVAQCLQQRQVLPLIDFAYQGFGDGLDEDAAGVRQVAEQLAPLFIASSYSKNFGLYRERVGALTVVGATAEVADTMLSHLKLCVRTNYSNPPAHGASIVTTILTDERLREQWEGELKGMRDRINGMRNLLAEKMAQHVPSYDFSFVQQQRGMFSFSGLSPEQVDRLRDEHAIYIVRSGRINVAGIGQQNVDHLCQAVAQVLG